MSKITIHLANKKFNLECAEDKHKYLKNISRNLSDEIEEILSNKDHVSFELALVTTALKLMSYKSSQIKLSGGQALEQAERTNEFYLSQISSKINNIISKIELYK